MGLGDCVGTPIKEGSVITYPGRRGSSMWMNAGRVVAIEYVEDRWRGMVPVLRVERREREWLTGEIKTRMVRVGVDRVTVTPLASLDEVIL